MVELKDCPECDMPLSKNGGCYYPYCCNPQKPRPPAQGEELVERVAQNVFEHWRFAAPVAWEPRGNSLKQEEARDLARAALSAMPDVVAEVVVWLLNDDTRLRYDEQPEAEREHQFWWAADQIQAKWGKP